MDAAHCLGILQQAEARWLEAVFLSGTFLPYTAGVLKSAAIPESASMGATGWRAFTVKISSGTLYKLGVFFSCFCIVPALQLMLYPDVFFLICLAAENTVLVSALQQ